MSATERAARIARGQALLRREGRADAAVMLVAKEFRPGITLDDYARVLDVNPTDIRAALRRRGAPPSTVNAARKLARRTASADAPTGPHRCTEPGCDASYPTAQGLASHRLAAHGDPIPCPKGCGRMVNPRGVGAHARRCEGAASP